MAGRDLEDFRRAFRTGERVTGRVLSRPDARHALVDISGFELLAATDTDPPPGARLTFFIARMHPVVVLREIARDQAPANAPDPRRVAGLLSSLASARTALETRLTSLGLSPAPGPTVDLANLKRRFLALLRADEKALAAYERSASLAREVAALPDVRRRGRYLYAPWYPPGAFAHELFLERPGVDGTQDIHLAFRLAGPGEIRIRARLQGDLARCMVFAAMPGRLDGRAFLPETVRLGRRVVRLELSAAPRPLAASPPSLAASLLPDGTRSFTGVNLRV